MDEEDAGLAKYKLVKDGTIGWMLLRGTPYPDTQRDGSPHPNAGETRWVPIKYPGRSVNAAAVNLLQASIPVGTEVWTYQDWRNVYEEAVAEVVGMIVEQ